MITVLFSVCKRNILLKRHLEHLKRYLLVKNISICEYAHTCLWFWQDECWYKN